MIDKFKNNTKIKIISLLSAIVLWLYVMAIVDPEETKLFEGIPIAINNMSELKEKNLVIYPDVDLTADLYVSGKVSNIQKVRKENIHIYGQINNPKEGKNEILLKANTSERVTHEFKNSITVVNLEKIVNEKRNIDIKVEGQSKVNIDKVSIDKGEDNIEISGPRVLVNQVQEVIGILDVGSKTNDFSIKINLVPVDKDGNEVDGVKLEKSSILVNVSLLKEKQVPIKLKLDTEQNKEINLSDYTLSQEKVTIKGKKDIIDEINYIETQEIDFNKITNTFTDLYLNIPEGISVENKYITIKRNAPKLVKRDFTYKPEEIIIKNNKNNIDISDINLPENVDVTIEYMDNVGDITKSDIKLYVDLLQDPLDDNKYDIKYDTKYSIDDVSINPKKTL